jgi:putative PIN family toxin of toxin-antitoxin system
MLWVSYCTRRDGYRHRLLERARSHQVRFFVSDYILDELSAVLSEDLGRSRRFVSLARRAVLRIAELAALPPTIRPRVPGDPNDDPIVQTALSAGADYLITADAELLALGQVEAVRVIPPSEFEQLLPPA